MLYSSKNVNKNSPKQITERGSAISNGQIDLLLSHIQRLQSEGNGVYPKGLFPSQRYHTMLPYRREDSNVFFTALILFTLNNVTPYCTPSQKQTIATITKEGVKCYPLYQSRKGLLTYNFWQTKPNLHFPHGYFLNKLKFLELPDDVDDTALIYLTTPHSKKDALWLINKLTQHANLSTKQIKNTFPKYRQLKAYSTWFGKNMYIEFDFCVLCNLMYCLHQYETPTNIHDEDTISYLREVIISDEHIHTPFRVAPSYPRTALILYHISRLITAFDIPKLNDLKEKITRQTHDLFHKKQPLLDKILLAIALGRLTGVCPDIAYSLPLPYKNTYFFNGGLLTAFENPVARKLAPFAAFHLKHTCEAYYLALLVEYEVMKGSVENGQSLKIVPKKSNTCNLK